MTWRDEKRTLNGHLVYLDSCIEYEEHKSDGTTYHMCPYCQKHATRSGKCATCLRAEKDKVTYALLQRVRAVNLNRKKQTWYEIMEIAGVEPDKPLENGE